MAELKDRAFTETELIASITKASLYEFTREFWSEISAESPHWNWHIEYLCDEIQKLAEGIFAGRVRPYDLVVNVSPGTTKPVWEGSSVMMADGTWKVLRDVVVGDQVIGKSGRGCRVAAVHQQGELPCVELTTMAGRSVKAALDHPVLTADGWREAGEIREGAMLALMHRPKISSVAVRTTDEFALAGYLIGDGSVSSNNLSLTGKNPDYLEDFRSLVERLGFDCTAKVAKNGVTIVRLRERNRVSQRGQHKGKGRGYRDRTGPRKWIEDVGLEGLTSRTKKVPDFVWQGTDDQVAAFLAAYFHCDGCVSYRHKPKRNLVVSATTISSELAVGIQRLFLRLGVSMRLRKRVAKKGFSYNRDLVDYAYYTVETTDQDAASRFLEKIPIKGYKLSKLEEFWPHRRTFAQKYWPDEVVKTEPCGSLPCRCLTVEDDESFVVEGVVVHNSTVFSVMFPAWAWTRQPSFRVIGASYAYSLAMDLSRKCRDVVRSEKYQRCFPYVKIREEQDSKGYFVNTKGGSRYAVGVNGSVMGMHAHAIVCDDPLDPEQSFSEAELKIANRWMTHTLPSRKVDKAVCPLILVQQRLHASDPTGDVLENAKREGAFPVRHVRLPADSSFEISPPELAARYVDGLMDPVRLPWSVLKAERARNEYSYVSQYGQDPRPSGSRMFEEEYFNQDCKAAPYNSRRIRYWDRAASENVSACYTAGVLIARSEDGQYYVEHVVRGQWEPSTRNAKMKAIAQRDRDKYGRYEPVIWVEREGGSAGRDAWKGVAASLAGFVVKEDAVSGKKEVRAEPWACQLAAKNVWLVRDGTWDVRAYVDEHVAFPHGKLKDQVDASTGAFNLLSQTKRLQGMKILSIRQKSKASAKLVVLDEASLADYQDDEYVLLVRVVDPKDAPAELATGHLENLLGVQTLTVPDVDPALYQDRWQEVVPEYGKPPAELVVPKELGRDVWRFVLKPREPYATRVLLVGPARLAAAVALGLQEALRLPEESLAIPPDASLEGGCNRHLLSVVKSSRNLV